MLGRRIFLPGCQQVPFKSLFCILFHTFSAFMHHPKIKLAFRISLLRGTGKPLKRFFQIFPHPFPGIITNSGQELCPGIPLPG